MTSEAKRTNFKSPGILPAGLYNPIRQPGTLFGDGTPGGIGDPADPTQANVAYLGFEADCANGGPAADATAPGGDPAAAEVGLTAL